MGLAVGTSTNCPDGTAYYHSSCSGGKLGRETEKWWGICIEVGEMPSSLLSKTQQ